MNKAMKLVLTGSIAQGYKAAAFLAAAEADQLARKTLAGGTLAEAIDVESPTKSNLLPRDSDAELHFIVMGETISGGHTVTGPFGDHNEAAGYAEAERSDGEEYAIFSCSRPAKQAARQSARH